MGLLSPRAPASGSWEWGSSRPSIQPVHAQHSLQERTAASRRWGQSPGWKRWKGPGECRGGTAAAPSPGILLGPAHPPLGPARRGVSVPRHTDPLRPPIAFLNPLPPCRCYEGSLPATRQFCKDTPPSSPPPRDNPPPPPPPGCPSDQPGSLVFLLPS